MNVTVLRETEEKLKFKKIHTYIQINILQLIMSIAMHVCLDMYVCTAWIIGSGYAIMIGSSTYVGMITVGRAEHREKAPYGKVTRDVGRDRLVRASLARRESCERRRRSQQPFQLQIYYNLIHHNLTQLA